MRRPKRPPNPLLPNSGAPGGATRSLGSAARRLFSLSILRRRKLYETREQLVYPLDQKLRFNLQDFSGPFGVVLVVLPEEPIEGYLGAEDGEKEGEEAVTEVVEPGCIDYEG